MAVYLILCLLAEVYVSSCSPQSCDTSHDNDVLHEGNNGETSALSWLGVLRVHLIEDTTFRMALTGIVLVKKGYAIVNANDVAKMPINFITERSEAVFTPTPKTLWFCNVKDYLTHPEYEYGKTNTLAILELDYDANEPPPFRPICWPPFTYNPRSHFYAFGFTDDKKTVLRKFVCGLAVRNQRDCIWENGMVLASNHTGYWQLIGFGVRGPGCAVPARFIDMSSYFSWIYTSTDQYVIGDGTRRSALNIGFKKNKTTDMADIPVHSLFSKNPSRRKYQGEGPYPADHNYINTDSFYPFDTEQFYNFNVERLDWNHILVTYNSDPSNPERPGPPYTEGNCSAENTRLVYNEHIVIKSTDDKNYAFALYKVTLADLWTKYGFDCVSIRVDPYSGNEKLVLYWSNVFDNMENMKYLYGDPHGPLTQYYIKNIITRPTPAPNKTEWKTGSKFDMNFIKDDIFRRGVFYNIFLKFQYKEMVTIKIKVSIINSHESENKTKTQKKFRRKTTKKPKLRTFKELLSANNMKKDEMGVEVKEVDRYMKDMALTAGCGTLYYTVYYKTLTTILFLNSLLL